MFNFFTLVPQNKIAPLHSAGTRQEQDEQREQIGAAARDRRRRLGFRPTLRVIDGDPNAKRSQESLMIEHGRQAAAQLARKAKTSLL